MADEGAMVAARLAIPGWPGYFADVHGQIWSRKSGSWHRLRPSRLKRGHLKVELSHYGHQRSQLVHRLVCSVFHGAPKTGQLVRHADDDPSNNRPDNLTWGTYKQNSDDMVRRGRSTFGSRNPMSKLTEANVLEIRRLRREGVSTADVACKFSIAKSNVSLIYNRISWRHI